MRRKYIVIVMSFLMTLFYACETEMMGYGGDSGVYFVMQRKPASGYGDPERFEYIDTTYIPFGMTSVKDTVLKVKVRVIGDVTEYDRYFTIKVDKEESTVEEGVDYLAFEERQLVKAGERETDIPCHIMWTEKLALNPDSMFYLTVRLEENEFFTLPLKDWFPVGSIYGNASKRIDPIVHVIGINDQLGKPSIWNESHWGTFSATKFKLIISVMGLGVESFEVYDKMDINRQMAIGRIMAKYLREEKAAGRTVNDYDKLGNVFEMRMGPSAV